MMKITTTAVPVLITLLMLSSPAHSQTELGGKVAVNRTNFDTTCAPCKDFNRYVNGRWERVTAAIGGGTFADMAQRASEAVNRLTGESELAVYGTSGDSSLRILGKLLKSCRYSRTDSAAMPPVEPLLKRVDDIHNLKDLTLAMAALDLAGITSVFSVNPEPDRSNAVRTIASIEQRGLGMPVRSYYVNQDTASERIRKGYVAHVSRMLALLDGDSSRAVAGAEQILSMETSLARAALDITEQRDPRTTYHPMTLSGLSKLMPDFDWKGYFKALGISSSGIVNVSMPEFMREANRLLVSVPLHQWQAYLRFRVLEQLATSIGGAYTYEHYRFREVLTGYRGSGGRSCDIGLVRDALGRAYSLHYFTPAAKARATDMVRNIKIAMRARILKSSWLSAPVRDEALAKLEAMDLKVGYSERWDDYADVTLKDSSYIENVLLLTRRMRRQVLDRIGKPTDRSIWYMLPSTVNAYYAPNSNEMVFPAAILQPPLFDAAADDASNYGAIGTVMGHEIVHAFDDQGRNFDAGGNLRDWWLSSDAEGFKSKAAVLVSQYNNYIAVDSLYVNGQLTLGENIADLGGVSVAYDALQLALKDKPRPLINGFTPEQRFFIAFANNYRSKTTPEQMRALNATDPHAPARWRVNGVLSQLPAFARAFGCEAGDPMVIPADKAVLIW